MGLYTPVWLFLYKLGVVMMKAIFTIEGKQRSFTLKELEEGFIRDNGDSVSILPFLLDCYFADESGFDDSFSKWLDWMLNDEEPSIRIAKDINRLGK